MLPIARDTISGAAEVMQLYTMIQYLMSKRTVYLVRRIHPLPLRLVLSLSFLT